MLITFDIDLLIKEQLDANQLTILYLINEYEIGKLNEYLKVTDKLDQFIEKDIYKLYKKGLLVGSRKEAYDFKDLEVTNKFTKLISAGDMFQELILTFPKTVTRPDGSTDYLLTDLTRAKATYAKLTRNNKALHEHILQCLRKEIENKEESDSMKFMKRLPKWISERTWESYTEQVGDLPANGNSFGYGERVE